MDYEMAWNTTEMRATKRLHLIEDSTNRSPLCGLPRVYLDTIEGEYREGYENESDLCRLCVRVRAARGKKNGGTYD